MFFWFSFWIFWRRNSTLAYQLFYLFLQRIWEGFSPRFLPSLYSGKAVALPSVSFPIIYKYRFLLNPGWGQNPNPWALRAASQGSLLRCLGTLLDSVAQSVGCFRQERGGAARPLTRFFFLINFEDE